jgi:hypothetical protein
MVFGLKEWKLANIWVVEEISGPHSSENIRQYAACPNSKFKIEN